jgi:hypothetical protein
MSASLSAEVGINLTIHQESYLWLVTMEPVDSHNKLQPRPVANLHQGRGREVTISSISIRTAGAPGRHTTRAVAADSATARAPALGIDK